MGGALPEEQNGRLHPFLRTEATQAAGLLRLPNQSMPVNPNQTLVDAVLIQMGIIPSPIANAAPSSIAKAVAQLAVTGRQAFNAFSSWHPQALPGFRGPQDSDLIQLVQQRNPNIKFVPANLQAAVSQVLDSAYSALWAIRGNDPASRAMRTQLGWIAVSGEDDTPHRPVNVFTAPYPQYDLPVTAQGYSGTLSKMTRYMIASFNTFLGPDNPPVGFPALAQPSAAPASPASPHLPAGAITAPRISSGVASSHPLISNLNGVSLVPTRQMPADAPVIPAGNKIIIYIHGGGSRLEEAVPLANNLILAGLTPGKNQNYTVISFDMPNSGYGDSFDPSQVYGSTYHPTYFHIMNFELQYVLGFMDALDQQFGNVKSRIVAVMGGSLGGNMSLMLARMNDQNHPYLKTIVAWSPTSMLKTSAIGEQITAGVNLNGTNWGLEGTTTRSDYFRNLYYAPTGNINGIDLLGLPPDPQMWYRSGWMGAANFDCKSSFIVQSRFDRYEIYSPQVRRWTTAIDTEQAMYSFQDTDANSATPRFQTISSRLLLAAGQNDNYGNATVNPGLVLAAATAGAEYTGTSVGAIAGSLAAIAGATLNNVDIYGYTHDVANQMLGTPGRTLFINNTGHSIHDERPQFFAQEIVHFLTEPDTTLRVDLTTGGDDLRWNSQALAVFNMKNGQGLQFPLNQWFHPWHGMPPAVDNPCFLETGLPCAQLNYFEFQPHSTHSFAVSLSRTNFSVSDIQSFGIQFFSGQRVPTDTGDNWDLETADLSAVSGPSGSGLMVSQMAQPLYRFTSPYSLWQTSQITDPVPQLSVAIVGQGLSAWGGNSWINVKATDPSGNNVTATVTINGSTGQTNQNIPFKNTCTMDQVLVGVNKNSSGSATGVTVPTGKKVDINCRGTVTAPGFARASFTASSETPQGTLTAQQQ